MKKKSSIFKLNNSLLSLDFSLELIFPDLSYQSFKDNSPLILS